MKFKAIVFVLQDVPVINIFKQTDIIHQFSPSIKLKNKIHVKSIFAVNICQNFMHLFLKAFQQTDSHGSAVQMSPESFGLFFHISNVYRPLILSKWQLSLTSLLMSSVIYSYTNQIRSSRASLLNGFDTKV